VQAGDTDDRGEFECLESSGSSISPSEGAEMESYCDLDFGSDFMEDFIEDFSFSAEDGLEFEFQSNSMS